MEGVINIIILGGKDVGKTTFVSRILQSDFLPITTTHGVETSFKTVIHNNNRRNIRIWDTGGDKCYIPLIKRYLNNVDIILFIINNNYKDLEIVKYWLKELQNIMYVNKPYICIVLFKNDNIHDGLSDSICEEFARVKGINFKKFKLYDNIEDFLYELVQQHIIIPTQKPIVKCKKFRCNIL